MGLSLPHAHPQLRRLKSNLAHPLPKPSAAPPILSAKKSPTRRDAQQSSTNTAHKLEDLLITDLSDMLSNVKLMLKLTHKFSVMVDSTTDSDMLDFMVDMPTMLPPSPSPSPPLSPRKSRLPALRSLPNIALMSQSSKRSSPPSRLATLSPRSSAHPPSTPSPRSPARPELPKLSSTPLSPDTLTMELTWDKNFKPKSRTAI